VRVAVIGGGSAGLVTAWLLKDTHEVTLFEKDERLGGHAHTVEAPDGKSAIPVESGFEFFTRQAHPAFCRLLGAIGASLQEYPLTFTLQMENSGVTHLLPPHRPEGMYWPAFAPASLLSLIRFEFFLRRAARLVHDEDISPSIGEFVDRFRFTRAFSEEFLWPFLVGGWCIPLADFRRLAAYEILKYLVLFRPRGLKPRTFTAIEGGAAAYTRAIRKSMPGVTVHTGRQIRCLRREEVRFRVADSAGDVFEFDHMVLATNAPTARHLLECVQGTEDERRVLRRFQYFETRIAVHGDRRFMPRKQRHWSVYNILWRKDCSWATVWRQQATGAPVFKTWLDPDGPLPEPLYHLTRYQHTFADADYLRAQRELATLQGRRKLWFAGAYTYDIDSHESAVQSAIRVARRLAPDSRNLSRLESH